MVNDSKPGQNDAAKYEDFGVVAEGRGEGEEERRGGRGGEEGDCGAVRGDCEMRRWNLVLMASIMATRSW